MPPCSPTAPAGQPLQCFPTFRPGCPTDSSSLRFASCVIQGHSCIQAIPDTSKQSLGSEYSLQKSCLCWTSNSFSGSFLRFPMPSQRIILQLGSPMLTHAELNLHHLPPPSFCTQILPCFTMSEITWASSNNMAVPTPALAAPGPQESLWAPITTYRSIKETSRSELQASGCKHHLS